MNNLNEKLQSFDDKKLIDIVKNHKHYRAPSF
jgi:hypothetical protein